MNGDIDGILAHVPPDKRITQAVWEFIDRDIRSGADLNPLQKDSVWAIVHACLEKNLPPPALGISFFAYCYHELAPEAGRSDEAKKRLAELVRLVKAHPQIASSVAQTAQHIIQEREQRKKDLARFLAAMAAEGNSFFTRGGDQRHKDPANSFVFKMQAARHGYGENTMPNLDLAVQLAEEAVDAYPTNPKVLFEAAGCHYVLAAGKSKLHSLMIRYLHLKQAYSLYQQCLERLSVQPYSNLKGEYDVWRKGIVELLPRIHQELGVMEEKQR